MRRVGLVGAGYISRVHAEALRSIPGVNIAAIVDPAVARATGLARDFGVPHVFGSIREALDADAFDCAHILVPPDAHHATALPLIEAGKPVLIEKPFAADSESCSMLLDVAARMGTPIGVNQNFVHHPTFVRLRHLVESRALGRPRSVSCIYNVPLRQLAARQFGHWMFRAPVNILLEQAVHPLSQIAALAGRPGEMSALAGPATPMGSAGAFHPTVDVSLACADLPAQLHFAVGQAFPFWQIGVVCDDGVAVADIAAGRLFTYRRTRWMEAVDGFASGVRSAAAIIGESCRNLARYTAATLHLTGRNDTFFQSMRTSIAEFHAALDKAAAPPLDGQFGAMLVDVCERIARQAFTTTVAPKFAAQATSTDAACDVAILGGTGFIGTQVVRRFVADGARVSVMARSIRNLPAIFEHPAVTLHAGDVSNVSVLTAAIGRAPIVINLAHGGGSGSWEEIRNAMVGGAETVAKVCLASDVRRLIHIGSIAALYLGPQSTAVTGATPPDPAMATRADYAHAKALCDQLLLTMHASEGLPVCILRPGVVVGDGASPFHSGIGFFNNDQHCIGWNNGRNPLPFVLVEDVAEAILLASRAEDVVARCYNLVGDVRLDAREYVAALAQAMQRPLRFHPQMVTRLWLVECAKWLVKRATGRVAPLPSRRDLLSRGMTATFDCTDAKRDLDWHPVADPAVFRERAILVHAG
jgi:predicted dehydrogenase/nucleoside-diphosphate-sugar epimerase